MLYASEFPKPFNSECLVEFASENEWPEIIDVTKVMEKVTSLRSDKKRLTSRIRQYNGNPNIIDRFTQSYSSIGYERYVHEHNSAIWV